MLNFILIFCAITGIVVAGSAALLPDTGVNGTPGAYLALLGTVGIALSLALLLILKLPRRTENLVSGFIALSAMLTGLAAWFLMQPAVVASMVIIILGLIARTIRGRIVEQEALT